MEREMPLVAKAWGTTRVLYTGPLTSTHYLYIHKGGFSSEHRHHQKRNIFFVSSGILVVTVWGKRDKNPIEHRIGPNEPHNSLEVEIGDWHMFCALTDVHCVEVYDYCMDGIDIDRRTHGGRDGVDA